MLRNMKDSDKEFSKHLSQICGPQLQFLLNFHKYLIKNNKSVKMTED